MMQGRQLSEVPAAAGAPCTTTPPAQQSAIAGDTNLWSQRQPSFQAAPLSVTDSAAAFAQAMGAAPPAAASTHLNTCSVQHPSVAQLAALSATTTPFASAADAASTAAAVQALLQPAAAQVLQHLQQQQLQAQLLLPNAAAFQAAMLQAQQQQPRLQPQSWSRHSTQQSGHSSLTNQWWQQRHLHESSQHVSPREHNSQRRRPPARSASQTPPGSMQQQQQPEALGTQTGHTSRVAGGITRAPSSARALPDSKKRDLSTVTPSSGELGAAATATVATQLTSSARAAATVTDGTACPAAASADIKPVAAATLVRKAGLVVKRSLSPAPGSGELPQLPAHLKKKVKIIQPISNTWEQDVLSQAPRLRAGGRQQGDHHSKDHSLPAQPPALEAPRTAVDAAGHEDPSEPEEQAAKRLKVDSRAAGAAAPADCVEKEGLQPGSSGTAPVCDGSDSAAAAAADCNVLFNQRHYPLRHQHTPTTPAIPGSDAAQGDANANDQAAACTERVAANSNGSGQRSSGIGEPGSGGSGTGRHNTSGSGGSGSGGSRSGGGSGSGSGGSGGSGSDDDGVRASNSPKGGQSSSSPSERQQQQQSQQQEVGNPPAAVMPPPPPPAVPRGHHPRCKGTADTSRAPVVQGSGTNTSSTAATTCTTDGATTATAAAGNAAVNTHPAGSTAAAAAVSAIQEPSKPLPQPPHLAASNSHIQRRRLQAARQVAPHTTQLTSTPEGHRLSVTAAAAAKRLAAAAAPETSVVLDPSRQRQAHTLGAGGGQQVTAASVAGCEAAGEYEDEDMAAAAELQDAGELSDGDGGAIESAQGSSDVEGDDMDVDTDQWASRSQEPGQRRSQQQQQQGSLSLQTPRHALQHALKINSVSSKHDNSRMHAAQNATAAAAAAAAGVLDGKAPMSARGTLHHPSFVASNKAGLGANSTRAWPSVGAEATGPAGGDGSSVAHQAAVLNTLLLAAGMGGYPLNSGGLSLDAALLQQLQQGGTGKAAGLGTVAGGVSGLGPVGVDPGTAAAGIPGLESFGHTQQSWPSLSAAAAAGNRSGPAADLVGFIGNMLGGGAGSGAAAFCGLQSYLSAAAAVRPAYTSPAANLAPLVQAVQAAALPGAPEGSQQVESVYRQLSLLYAWYASSRAAYLEQVQMLLQLAERDRLMAAALHPSTAAVRPPALRALDKALEIIRGSQMLEQMCLRNSAGTATQHTHPAAAAAAPGACGGDAAAAGQAADVPDGSAAAHVRSATAGSAAISMEAHPKTQPEGPSGAATAAAAAITAMLQNGSLGPATAGTSHAARGTPLNAVQQQQQQQVVMQQLQPLLQQLSGLNPQQQQQQQQQDGAAVLVPLLQQMLQFPQPTDVGVYNAGVYPTLQQFGLLSQQQQQQQHTYHHAPPGVNPLTSMAASSCQQQQQQQAAIAALAALSGLQHGAANRSATGGRGAPTVTTTAHGVGAAPQAPAAAPPAPAVAAASVVPGALGTGISGAVPDAQLKRTDVPAAAAGDVVDEGRSGAGTACACPSAPGPRAGTPAGPSGDAPVMPGLPVSGAATAKVTQRADHNATATEPLPAAPSSHPAAAPQQVAGTAQEATPGLLSQAGDLKTTAPAADGASLDVECPAKQNASTTGATEHATLDTSPAVPPASPRAVQLVLSVSAAQDPGDASGTATDHATPAAQQSPDPAGSQGPPE